jgi:hypothetical protein
MFIAPEFVTREQFPNAEGQGFEDLVTLRYSVASLILALVVITYHLREIEGLAFQIHVMRVYSIAFSLVCMTNVVFHMSSKISAGPPIVGTGIIALLSIITWRNLSSDGAEN